MITGTYRGQWKLCFVTQIDYRDKKGPFANFLHYVTTVKIPLLSFQYILCTETTRIVTALRCSAGKATNQPCDATCSQKRLLTPLNRTISLA